MYPATLVMFTSCIPARVTKAAVRTMAECVGAVGWPSGVAMDQLVLPVAVTVEATSLVSMRRDRPKVSCRIPRTH